MICIQALLAAMPLDNYIWVQPIASNLQCESSHAMPLAEVRQML